VCKRITWQDSTRAHPQDASRIPKDIGVAERNGEGLEFSQETGQDRAYRRPIEGRHKGRVSDGDVGFDGIQGRVKTLGPEVDGGSQRFGEENSQRGRAGRYGVSINL